MLAAMNADTDFELLAKGDTSAFERIFERYYGRLHNYLLSLCGEAILAEDLAQDSFVNFWQHRAEYRHRGNFAVYLFTIGRNAWLNHLKSSKRAQEKLRVARIVAQRLHVTDEATQDEDVVNGALARLPAEQREVVVLKVFHAMTFPEISEVLGVHGDAVVSRYRYGIKKLADIWNSRGGQE